MSQLLDALRLFDPTVAALYVEDTGDRPGAKIKKATAERIMNRIITDKFVSDKEANALHQLFAFAKFEPGALELIIRRLYAEAIVSEDFEKNPPSASLMKRIKYALSGTVTGRIQFVSPKTNIPYSPTHYAAVARLIDSKDITIMAIPSGIGRLVSMYGEGDASYLPDTDRMWLPDWDFDYPPFYQLVVHEATHAIQDWLDEPDLFHWNIETDAYVAGAIAAFSLSLKSEAKGEHPELVAQNSLKDLLKSNTPLVGPKFNGACEAVFNAVKKFSIYKDKKDLKYAQVDKPRTEKERKTFFDMYQAAQKAAATP